MRNGPELDSEKKLFDHIFLQLKNILIIYQKKVKQQNKEQFWHKQNELLFPVKVNPSYSGYKKKFLNPQETILTIKQELIAIIKKHKMQRLLGDEMSGTISMFS